MKPRWLPTAQLRPADLAARDGYLEDLLTRRARSSVADAYGVLDGAFDEDAGARGEIVVRRLDAILPSGLLVQVDPQAPLRRSLPEVPEGASGAVVLYVAVPRTVLRGPNVSREGGPPRSTRYLASAGDKAGSLQAQPELLLGEELHDGYEAIRIGRAQRVGRSVRLERGSIPTVLRIRASSALEEGLKRLVKAMQARRAELVAYRKAHPLSLGAIVGADLPGLQLSSVVQRYLPLLTELGARRSAHPHELYEDLVAVHGALGVFGHAEAAPPYDHEAPEAVFPWLFERIERIIHEAARDGTTILPFQRVDASTFRLSFERADLAGKRPLLVLSNGEEEFLQDRVPSLLKMASPTAIAPLLHSALRGVAVAVEFEPPAVVPRTRGTAAYRINVRDALWLDIEDRMQIQLALPGAPPSLEAYLYGVERVA